MSEAYKENGKNEFQKLNSKIKTLTNDDSKAFNNITVIEPIKSNMRSTYNNTLTQQSPINDIRKAGKVDLNNSVVEYNRNYTINDLD